MTRHDVTLRRAWQKARYASTVGAQQNTPRRCGASDELGVVDAPLERGVPALGLHEALRCAKPGRVRLSSKQATPDILAPGLEALFVGINPGLVSAQQGHNFANPGNGFWRLMHESGLVPKRLRPDEEMELLHYGLGLTNLVGRATRGVNDLGPDDYAIGRKQLAAKIRKYEPRRVVFVGITVCRSFFDMKASKPIECGEFPERIHGSRVFVVPNPSGRNAHFSYAEMLAAFRLVARAMGRG